jgi:peptide/nickel transport system substrate-binding protein
LMLIPRSGGTFVEAEVGQAKILNPVLPDTSASNDVNALIYDGLTKWGPGRKLLPDLAASWEISADARTYTFHLRHGVKWHDGVPFTSADVLFTLTAIQNPDSRSPLAASWQGVTAESPDQYTVIYHLPTSYPPFLDSTTQQIVPRHALESIEPSLLRTAQFNQQPIGTGPFKISSFQAAAGQIILTANPNYFEGRPKLDRFEFKMYESASEAMDAYAKQQVTSVGRVEASVQDRANREANLYFYDDSLPSESMVFFNMADAVMGDHALRQALAQATDRQKLIDSAEPALATAQVQPILPGQPGYTNAYRADRLDLKGAAKLLDGAGWKTAKGGFREKDGKKLELHLVTVQDATLQSLATHLADQWSKIGVKLDVKAVGLDEFEQSYVKPRNFQLLLFGISIGPDPDVYAYWHSSQISDPGLNLSQYKSTDADRALETGRLKSDPQLRAVKYNAFLKAWDADQPAIVLASPIYRYAVDASVGGLVAGPIVEPSNRFWNVKDWTTLRQAVRRGHKD